MSLLHALIHLKVLVKHRDDDDAEYEKVCERDLRQLSHFPEKEKEINAWIQERKRKVLVNSALHKNYYTFAAKVAR